jgi:hypothetical protein
MSEEQKALKQARKTGPYTVTWQGGYYWDPKNVIPKNVKDSWAAASQVRDNALRITAALNLYHEKRGSPHRHNVPDHLKLYYGKLIVELNNEVNALERAHLE